MHQVWRDDKRMCSLLRTRAKKSLQFWFLLYSPFRPSDIVNLTVSSLNAYRFSELLIKFDSFIVLHRLTTFMYIFLDLKTGWKIARWPVAVMRTSSFTTTTTKRAAGTGSACLPCLWSTAKETLSSSAHIPSQGSIFQPYSLSIVWRGTTTHRLFCPPSWN